MKNINVAVNEILPGEIKACLPVSGYRHAIDPFLLSAFSSVGKEDNVVDLGTAAGIMPLVLTSMGKGSEYRGVEIQAGLSEQAKENVKLNFLEDRVEIINADIREIPGKKILPHEYCDVVVSNPPYRKLETGKVAPNSERAACRHEVNGELSDFVEVAFYLLRNKGKFCLIYLPERLPELLSVMGRKKIEPKRLRMVHSRMGGEAVMVMVEGLKNGKPGMKVEAPLYIYDGEEYSREVKEIFRKE